MAKGYAHVQGFDYEDTFAPTTWLTTIRSVLALTASEGWPMYLKEEVYVEQPLGFQGDLKEEVYVEQPRGFVLLGSKDKVCKLKKALYGLKQAPWAWYQQIDAYFLWNKFKRSSSNDCLYIFKKGGKCMIVALYVDDLIMTRNHEDKISQMKQMLSGEFEMIDLRQMHFCLGIEV